MDYYEIDTGPASDPVTLDDAKDFLKIKSGVTKDDDIITELITTATLEGEKYTRRDFVERTWEGFFSGFQVTQCEVAPFIELRRAPLSSVSEVALFIGGSYAATSLFSLKQNHSFPRILFYDTLPNTDSETVYPIRVTFVSGYSTVPAAIKTAIKLHVSFLYENRGDVQPVGGETIPDQVRSIYSRGYKIINTF